MTRDRPLVSVVIPTIGRPDWVVRAARSALAQTLRAIEVIVVVDGPHEPTTRALRQIEDDGLRIVELLQWVGLGGARNAGVATARGRWVALLDDDDEWLPRKLEIQLHTAQQSARTYPIVSCRFIDRRPHGEAVLPSRFPEKDEAVSEYLFCLRRLVGGEGVVLPSTVLAARDLLARVPFRFAQFAHEGSDWLLRALRQEGVGLEFVPTHEPLAIRHAGTLRTRMSNTTDWRTSLAWAEDNAHLLTRRAHAAFILKPASLEARRARDGRAFWRLLWESFRRGRPTGTGILVHVLIWLVPERARFRIAALAGALMKRPVSR